MKKKHRVKFCGKCLKNNEAGSKNCIHCGWTFKRGQFGQMIDKLRKYFEMVGARKIG